MKRVPAAAADAAAASDFSAAVGCADQDRIHQGCADQDRDIKAADE